MIRARLILALVPVLAVMAVIACGQAKGAPQPAQGPADADATILVNLGQAALQRVRGLSPSAVLRQVNVVADSGPFFFQFTDAAATQEISVTVPSPDAEGGAWEVKMPSVSKLTSHQAPEMVATVPSPDAEGGAWEVKMPSVSKLTSHQAPEMALNGLRVGPANVARVASGHWQGCRIRGRSLVGDGEELVWYVFCDLLQDVVSGTVDGRTAEFVPSSAPPAIVPPIATPKP